MRISQILPTLTIYLPLTTATIQTYTPPTHPNLTYSITLPNTTTPHSGPIYIQISAPTTLQWASLGQGADMSTANIFILWAASTTEVTLSPRSGGSGEPTYNPRANVTLLPGSGVANGTMTANIRCENCLSTWPSSESGDTAVAGFEMDPNGNATEWFWACQSGEMLGTDDPSADLGMHDDKGVIMFDLSRARFPVEEGVCLEGVNPFV